MGQSSKTPPLIRSYSSEPLGSPQEQTGSQSPPNEATPLLSRRARSFLSPDDSYTRDSRSHELTKSGSIITYEPYARSRPSAVSLRSFIAQTLGREQVYGYGPGDNPREPGYHHSLYDQFTSIDWVQDTISHAQKRKQLRNRKGILGSLWARLYSSQGWILAALVGVLTALVTYFIDVSEGSLFDTKFGHCSGNWRATRMQCCARATKCDEWIPWSKHISSLPQTQRQFDFLLYVTLMLIMALLSCMLVLADKRVISAPRKGAYVDLGPPIRSPSNPGHREIVLYPGAGSGVAEVKVISSGFIIHGFLGVKTLLVKTLGCVLSVASGLSIGKEGPYVHIAACIGNVMSRLFPSYDDNEGKRREIISASSAAGIAVAFGAPISGVIFSLEEVSYYFPAKTLFRTFFCSIIAAVSLKFLNPYLNGQIVPFEVEYTSDWHAFEVPLFIVLGVCGGVIGALFVKATRLWMTFSQHIPLAKNSPLLLVMIVALVSGVTSYWNRYSTLPVAQLMFELANDCGSFRQAGASLCPSAKEIPHLIGSLATAFLIKFFLTTISFGLKIPSGIYVPAMVLGGLFGRAFGHAVQYAIISTGSTVFGSCSIDKDLEGCVVPGVYALVTAGATMAGVSRLALTLALILFEITGSLDHVLPFSIAVLVAKWTSNAIEPQSIYDLYMQINSYPYLDNKIRPNLEGTLADITPRQASGRTIDISLSPRTPGNLLREKLDFLLETGQFDCGLPILRDQKLIGIISCLDLAFCLDRLKDRDRELCLVSPRGKRTDDGEEYIRESDTVDVTDFSPFIDSAPLSLDIHTSLELVYECFVKLGVRYICVLQDGCFVGLIHKKAFVKYAREA